MANVRLLRQGIEDYQKRVEASNAAIDASNAAYEAAYAGYAGQTDAYNASVNAFNAAAQGGGVYSDGGKYFDVSTGAEVQGGLTTLNGKQMFELPPAGIMMGSDNDAASTGGGELRTYIGAKPGAAPTAPAEPAAPEPVKVPNLTTSNMAELSNPGLDQAGIAMARAQGFEGKSALKGDEMTGAGSAFADPEDPNNLAERGILARVMGGQL